MTKPGPSVYIGLKQLYASVFAEEWPHGNGPLTDIWFSAKEALGIKQSARGAAATAAYAKALPAMREYHALQQETIR